MDDLANEIFLQIEAAKDGQEREEDYAAAILGRADAIGSGTNDYEPQACSWEFFEAHRTEIAEALELAVREERY